MHVKHIISPLTVASTFQRIPTAIVKRTCCPDGRANISQGKRTTNNINCHQRVLTEKHPTSSFCTPSADSRRHRRKYIYTYICIAIYEMYLHSLSTFDGASVCPFHRLQPMAAAICNTKQQTSNSGRRSEHIFHIISFANDSIWGTLSTNRRQTIASPLALPPTYLSFPCSTASWHLCQAAIANSFVLHLLLPLYQWS